MLSVSLLGDFSVRHDEKPVSDIDTPRLQSLLAYLLLHREAPQPRAHLAFLFWPDTTEAQARTNLRNLLHHLRHVLPDEGLFLDADPQTLQWRSDAPFTLDVTEFERALAQAEQAQRVDDPAGGRLSLEQAIEHYQGDLLPSCYDEWIVPKREALHQAYLYALERLARLLEEQRDYPAAIHNAQRLLQADPLREAAYRHLMRLHALNGDRASALRAYHSCTTVLRRELDVEPGAATREVYEGILGGASESFPDAAPPAAFFTLVGREGEWTQMLRDWRTAVSGGGPRMVILRGEAGIGKTRLVEELLQWGGRQGIANTSARCYAAEGGLAYSPVTTWLRGQKLAPLEDIWLTDVARLLPEVLVQRPDLPRPNALTETWQRQRLFEALSRAILGIGQPLLLMIDDLQWCDRDTLEWLHFLLRFNREARLLIVGTYRPEEVDDTHPLVSLLQALRLDGLTDELDLQPLDATDTRTLATRVAGKQIDDRDARQLFTETEGNPLFVVETVRAGLSARDQVLGGGPAESWLTPGRIFSPKVRSVLEARLAQVSPRARELAGLAAAIGREFSFRLLAKASSRDDDTLVRELDELWRRKIVREHGVDAYDFSHDKLREAAYFGLSPARRQLLHRQVALALEELHAADPDPVSHQVAVHYERSGLARQAVPYYLRAARVARQVFANEEAIALLQRGIALVSRDGTGADLGTDAVAASLWEEFGDIIELMARHEEALDAYRNALELTARHDRIGLARRHRKQGAVRREQRFYKEALDACRQAETILGEKPGGETDDWWEEWITVQLDQVWAHYWLALWPEMDALVNRIRPVVQARVSVASRVHFLMASCLVHLRRERYVVSDEMLENAREALAGSLQLGSLKTRIECQFELGFLCLWRRRLDEAEKNLHTALDLAESAGMLPYRTLCLTYLTVLRRFQGDLDGAAGYARRAWEAAEAAHMPDYSAAAAGNQAWIAWRGQDHAAAGQKSRQALNLWRQSPLVYPFQWMALWPRMAFLQVHDLEEEAWDCACAILAPTQQLMPEPLNARLQDALQAWSARQVEVARTLLAQAAEHARELGYL